MVGRTLHRKALRPPNQRDRCAITSNRQQFLRCWILRVLMALLALPGTSTLARSNEPLVKATTPVRLQTVSAAQQRDFVAEAHKPVVKVASPVRLPTAPAVREHESASEPQADSATSPSPQTGVPGLLSRILPDAGRTPLLDLLGGERPADTEGERRSVPSSAAERAASTRRPLGLRLPFLVRSASEHRTGTEITKTEAVPQPVEAVSSRIADVKPASVVPVEIRSKFSELATSNGDHNKCEETEPPVRKTRFVRREVDRLQRLASSEQRQLATNTDSHRTSTPDERGMLISFLRHATRSEEQWPAVARVIHVRPVTLRQPTDDSSEEATPTNAEEPQGPRPPAKPTVVTAEEPRPSVAPEPVAAEVESRKSSEPGKPTVVNAEEPLLTEPTEPKEALAEEPNAAKDDTDTAKIAEAAEDDETTDLPDLNDDGLKSMRELTLDIRPEEGELPKDLAAAKFLDVGEVRHPAGTNRPWPLYEFWWEAPAVCHRPLYFEEVNLERYGYSHGLIQPILSGAHFFGKVPALPYLMTAEPHRDCVYTLGHYPPGSYAPYHIHYPPVSLRAAAVEAAVLTGLIFAIP